MATSMDNTDEATDRESTNEDIVMAALEGADDPLSLSELDDRISDLSYKRISATLSDLSGSDVVDRNGKGGPHDPYRYEVNGDDGDTNAGLGELFDGEESEGDLSGVFEGTDGDDVDGEFDYVCLPDSSTEADVEYGTRYRCRVNGTEPYGVFVSLTTDPDWDNEVTGLVHKKRVPNLYSPDDFYTDDEVGVMLFDRTADGLEFEIVAAFDTVRGLDFEQEPMHADDNKPPDDEATDDYEAALARAKGDDEDDRHFFDDLTHKEKRVVAALEAADVSLSASDVSTWLADESRGGIGERLRDLSERGVITRSGEGVRGDPYRYEVGDVTVPPYAVDDLPPKPDLSDAADEDDEPEAKTSREVALEYVDGADADDLLELWEAAGVMPGEGGEPLPDDAVSLDEDGWVDVVFAIGDSHISVDRTRELIKTVNRQVWGGGSKIDDDREA